MSIDKVAGSASRVSVGDAERVKTQTRIAEAKSTEKEVATRKQEVATTSDDQINAVARQIESYLKNVGRSLEFKVDSKSGQTVISVRDAENGELIRQIPNEEVLRFAQLAEEQTVVLLNEKV